MTTLKSFFSYIIILSCLFFHCSLSAASIQYENQIIEHIDILVEPADVNFDPQPIKARIKSKTGDLFSQSVFDSDLKTLALDYNRVDPILDCVNGKVFIKLKIQPKPIIRVLSWSGNERLSTDELTKELGILPGSIFDRLAFNKAFHKLKTYYVTQGFFEAELDYMIIPEPSSNRVDIEVMIREGRAGRISHINFVGFTTDEIDDVCELMITKPYSRLTSWFTGEGSYHEEAIQQDEFVILNYLQNEGYADAKVMIKASESCPDRIALCITANKGQKYYFGHISVNGNTLFDQSEIWNRVVVTEGNHYSPELLTETVTNITDYYGKYGYIDAVVNFEPRLVCDKYIYDIDFVIEEGEQFRVGLIKVFGNCMTQARVILHETLLTPGEVFNTGKLKLTEARLNNIGYFKTVNVYAVKSEECGTNLGGNFRDVHIEVEEKSTGHFGLSLGYSTTEGVFGSFSITETNFNYKGLRHVGQNGLSVLRGGGEYASFNTTLGSKTRSNSISWSKPYFRDTLWVVGFDLENANTRYVSNDYNIQSSGVNIHAAYPINPFLRGGIYYRLKYSHVDIDKDKASRALLRAARHSGLISAIGASLTYDTTNHPLYPTRGYKSRLDAEYAGLGGRHHFLGFAYLNSYYFKFKNLDKKGIWKIRGDVRFIVPLDPSKPNSIPIDERIFLGGANMIRGYRPYQLGPEYRKNHDPKGGISMQLLSLEYSRPLFSRFEGFAFVDAGHLSLKKWDFTEDRLYTAIGYGFRVAVFPNAPPIVLGMGYPLNEKKSRQVKRFFMTLGGNF